MVSFKVWSNWSLPKRLFWSKKSVNVTYIKDDRLWIVVGANCKYLWYGLKQMRYIFFNRTTSHFDINFEIFYTIRYNIDVDINIEIISIQYRYRHRYWFIFDQNIEKSRFFDTIQYRFNIFRYKYRRYFNPISYRIENFWYPKSQYRICLIWTEYFDLQL